jgi:hypothetical protein
MMEMVLECNGGVGVPRLASQDGEGENARCSHNIDDRVIIGGR